MPVSDKPKYGPMYGSKAKKYYAIIQGADPIIHPTSGKQVGHKKEILAEFFVDGPEYDIPTPDGGSMPYADFHGNFFHLDIQAEEKGWTDEEKEMVRTRLDFLCEKFPGDVWHIESALLQPPLPGWNDLSDARKLAIAAELGPDVLANALAYEQQEDANSEVVARLHAKLGKVRQEAEDAEALTA